MVYGYVQMIIYILWIVVQQHQNQQYVHHVVKQLDKKKILKKKHQPAKDNRRIGRIDKYGNIIPDNPWQSSIYGMEKYDNDKLSPKGYIYIQGKDSPCRDLNNISVRIIRWMVNAIIIVHHSDFKQSEAMQFTKINNLKDENELMIILFQLLINYIDQLSQLLDLNTQKLIKLGVNKADALQILKFPNSIAPKWNAANDDDYDAFLDSDTDSDESSTSEENIFVDESNINTLNIYDEKTNDFILLMRGLLYQECLFLVLMRRYAVNYGLHELRKDTLMAVPFRAKNTPSERSEYSHPDIAIMYTILSYYQNKLNDKMMNKIFKHESISKHYNIWLQKLAKLD
eukprot:424846_1